MSWKSLLDLIADEIGMDAARRIEQRARLELGGVRITVSVRPWVWPQLIDETDPGRPRRAAKKLGIHPATAYRMLRRDRLIR
jgi:hypothetical protein